MTDLRIRVFGDDAKHVQTNQELRAGACCVRRRLRRPWRAARVRGGGGCHVSNDHMVINKTKNKSGASIFAALHR
jgi:hypothetical protein